MTLAHRLPRLPAPSRPRRYTVTSRAKRAANIRKWLAYGSQTRSELAFSMQCTRYALYHTLKLMPDVIERDGFLMLAPVTESLTAQTRAVEE